MNSNVFVHTHVSIISCQLNYTQLYPGTLFLPQSVHQSPLPLSSPLSTSFLSLFSQSHTHMHTHTHTHTHTERRNHICTLKYNHTSTYIHTHTHTHTHTYTHMCTYTHTLRHS